MSKNRTKKKPVLKARPKNGYIHSQKKLTATETINCDASKWLQTQDQVKFMAKLTPEEFKYITKHSGNGFKIIKGMQYTSQVVEFNGKMVRSNFLQAIHIICHKYKVYPKN